MGIYQVVALCVIIVLFNIVLAFELVAIKKKLKAARAVSTRLGAELATVRAKIHKIDVKVIENSNLIHVINGRGRA